MIDQVTKRDLLSHTTSNSEVILITIYPVDGEPVRFCNYVVETLEETDRYDIMGVRSSGSAEAIELGDTLDYPWLFVQVTLPEVSRTDAPAATLTFDNLDRVVSDAARSTIERARVTFEIVTAFDPHTVLETLPEMRITSADADLVNLTLEAGYDHWLDQEVCSWKMDERTCPTIANTP